MHRRRNNAQDTIQILQATCVGFETELCLDYTTKLPQCSGALIAPYTLYAHNDSTRSSSNIIITNVGAAAMTA
uniref:Uncharacterized protein n=1 Tax=Trichogramma kaykai TaxID=54128 RepID=A0ABD2XCN2_9HYME